MNKSTKYIVTIEETVTRTIRYDKEISIPNGISYIEDYINENIDDTDEKARFLEIVDSKFVDAGIINFEQGEINTEKEDRYTIKL